MPDRPDLSAVYEVVHPRITGAMEKASAQLHKLGIRHALVGALAVGAHGFPRSTKDVDFLVGAEAFEHHGAGLISPVAGLPISVDGVAIDFLPVEHNQPYLVPSIESPQMSHGIPVADIEAVVYTKLKSPRPKDRLDLLELAAIGMDTVTVRAFLTANAPELVSKFDGIVAEAGATTD